MTDIDTTTGLDTTEGQGGRKGQAKQALNQASQTLKQEAQTFASAASEKARAEALRRQQTATKTLGDFANAIRKAGDELSQADQSPAARLIGQAADGLENLTRSLENKQPEELLDAVRDFGRRHPMAFIGGAVLVGVALGRFVRATEAEAEMGGDLGGADMGGEAYPLAETSAYAAGPTATADAALGMEGTDAEVETAALPTDGLDGLTATDADDTANGIGGTATDERRGM